MANDQKAPWRQGDPDCDFGMESTLPIGGAFGREAVAWERGARIDRYELIREIGAGAMGVVWSARDIDLDRTVALKLIRPGGSSPPLLRERLLREARALARSPHPNVVPIHDIGTTEGNLFIAMEHLEGDTLSEWLRAAPRHWTEVVDKFIAAGRGLAATHHAGLVHRDFKPENILLDRSGTPKVADFGLAVPAIDEPGERGDSEPALAPDGDLVGTLAFMAPEQLVGDRVTARSDQFSFCVSLYEALYGVRPFGAPAGDAHAAILLAAIVEGRLSVGAPDRAAAVPERIRSLILRGLAYDPADRWTTMDEFLEALAQALASGARRSWANAATSTVANLAAGLGNLRRRWSTPTRRALYPAPIPVAQLGQGSHSMRRGM